MWVKAAPDAADESHPTGISDRPGTREGDLEAITVDGVVCPEECDRLVALFHEHERAGRTKSAGHSTRCEVYLGGYPEAEAKFESCRPVPGLERLSQRIAGMIHVWNAEFYRFDMARGNNIPPLVVVDRVNAGGSGMGWHSDYTVKGSRDAIQPKLNGVIQLSDPSAYEGGDLQIYTGDKVMTGSRERGDMVLFPSFLLHRRMPVTRGSRMALIVLAYGVPFR